MPSRSNDAACGSLPGPSSAPSRGWLQARPLLVCYAPVADPQCPDDTLAIYAQAGVDVVEVGIPTPAPYLDGPAVADSMGRIVQAGRVRAIPEILARQAGAIRGRYRIVLMGYDDLPFRDYTTLAHGALVHGLLMIGGAQVRESPALASWLADTAVARVGFVDAGLSGDSIERARHAGGYVMLQGHAGPTGVRATIDRDNESKIRSLRRAGIDLPIVLGFGIGTAAQAAAAIALGADGVVVGSACIEAAQRGAAALESFVRSLRAAIDEAARST